MLKICVFLPILLLFLSIGNAYAENYVGFILKGYEKECKILRKDKEYNCDSRKLYINDILIKKPSLEDIKIKWAPYVKPLHKDKFTLEIVALKSNELKNNIFVSLAQKYLDDFIKPAEHEIATASTRESQSKYFCELVLSTMLEQLPPRATLLPNMPIEFKWKDSDIQSITFSNGLGQKIFERNVKGRNSIQLQPNEIGIKSNEIFSWQLNGDVLKHKYTVSLIDEITSKEIIQGLKDIDSENTAETQKTIRKASFLQLVSEAYSDKIDLYWLSSQILPIKDYNLNKEEEKAICGLKLRYFEHQRGNK